MRKGLTKSGRAILLVLGALIVFASLIITYQMAETLSVKERHDVELWAAAMERVNREAMGDYMSDPLVSSIINNRNNIPFIILFFTISHPSKLYHKNYLFYFNFIKYQN